MAIDETCAVVENMHRAQKYITNYSS